MKKFLMTFLACTLIFCAAQGKTKVKVNEITCSEAGVQYVTVYFEKSWLGIGAAYRAASGSGWSVWVEEASSTCTGTLKIEFQEISCKGNISSDASDYTTLCSSETLSSSYVDHWSLGTMDRCCGVYFKITLSDSVAGTFELNTYYDED